MSSYVVKFLKDLEGDNGRCVEVCQQVLDVNAPTPADAIDVAKHKFCAKRRIKDWSLRADRIVVSPADFPS